MKHWLIKKIVTTDRLSTGFAVADLDLSKVEAVRTRMPIAEVLMLSQGPSLFVKELMFKVQT